MTLHSFKREYKGEGIEQGITPTCSCGWKGREEFAWNDWQMTNVADQESQHRAELAAAQLAPKEPKE